MSFEEPKAGNDYSPEQQEALEGQRTISDAELVKGGAKWKIRTDGKKTLQITPEQAAEAREEKEGLADTLGTYIRMHKRIAIPKQGDELTPHDKFFAEDLDENKGAIWDGGGDLRDTQEFYFVDRNGDLCVFDLDVDKVKSLHKAREEAKSRGGALDPLKKAVQQELTALGFTVIRKDATLPMDADFIMGRRMLAAQAQEREQKNREFNF
jgi:hypothetical protein